jgi:hypothetical protein
MLDEQPIGMTSYSLSGTPPEPEQRRASERHLSLLRVGSLIINERRELCLIRNISAGGMMIRAYSNLKPGMSVSIELKQGEPINGSVQWTKDGNVGVSFDRPIDVVGLISTPDEGPRPRMPRIEVNCAAWVREDATIHRAKAVDVSQGGLKVTSTTDIATGAEVIVTLNGLPPIPAVVRWKDDNLYGITFNRTLGLSSLVPWLQAQQERELSRVAS